MLGLVAIGVALILGVFMNLAAGAGARLLLLMWTAVLPRRRTRSSTNRIIYALTLGLLSCLGAGRWLGLGDMRERTRLVRKVPVLR
jgi:thiosulfate dehydrogenase (quinone) large subunit